MRPGIGTCRVTSWFTVQHAHPSLVSPARLPRRDRSAWRYSPARAEAVMARARFFGLSLSASGCRVR